MDINQNKFSKHIDENDIYKIHLSNGRCIVASLRVDINNIIVAEDVVDCEFKRYITNGSYLSVEHIVSIDYISDEDIKIYKEIVNNHKTGYDDLLREIDNLESEIV